ncbi:MAG: hypothetical protein M3R45_09420 [Pseudomonadota bacterium]|nr:hypothetical protein [Pseudomonadota bacterium]
MAMNLNPGAEPAKNPGYPGNGRPHDFDGQRLRILRCTAHAMASSPGGLRFKAGTRPWLEGLPMSIRLEPGT